MRKRSLFMTASVLLTVAVGTAAHGEASPPVDVFIYRATPGGIAAAVAAARHGRRVVLCEYHGHVGGMTTSGLGKSDIENRAMIGGLFKEFVAGVKEHYVVTYGADHPAVTACHDGYYAEPSVAERVFDAMLAAEPTIEVLRQHRLDAATVVDDRLSAVEIIDRASGNRRRIQADVFVDASYEGDLLAAAGARYRLGRESRDEFGEPHAGVVYHDYREKRLLPGTTGAGDDRLPAFTYRLCLTTDPANAVPLVEPPPGYDRSRYTGYFDDLAAGRLAGPKVLEPGRGYNPRHFDTLVRALSVAEIPAGKADVNINPRPLGFPFPEENVGYVEGDDAERQRICEHLRNLTLGLLWFLQNDSEVPEAHRQLAREWQLPADEFTDNGHFPWQLYVREGRRLVGVATLTEHDITGRAEPGGAAGVRRQPDSIAVGEFPIDSFPCRKRQAGDTIVLEGYLGMLDHITRPYEIPYRIMIPERIDGLIVPVAASTTHVAFSSIRMEPTWMALGQAAGTAAHLAVARNVSLRKLPIAPLQQMLLAAGQVIHHPEPAYPDPAKHPESPLMLAGEWMPDDPRTIDFQALPKIESTHAVVSDVSKAKGVNQHNYLVHHDGRYWAMWSDGPGNEDKVGQVVKYATSHDALTWSEPVLLTPYPPGSAPGSPHYGERTAEGLRWIARGFWQRDGDLLALASLDEAGEFFGKSLALHAFRWEGRERGWVDLGSILDDAINNFSPQKLPNGDWMMSRRRHDYGTRGVDFAVGGVTALDAWESFPVLGSSSELGAEEPDWWVLPDGNLCGLFRDNKKRGFLYRSFSTDSGRTWSRPVQTNFPDATSKFRGLRLADGRYVLVSNANPKMRDPLVISVSRDGLVFDQMGWLVGGRHVDYPHVIEHDGHLLVAFATRKMTVEVLRFPLAQLDRLQPILHKKSTVASVADDGAPAIVSRGYVAGDLPTPSCHASTIAETTPGEFIAAWFGGTAEKNPDVGIWTSRLEHGSWSKPVEVATGVQPGGTRWPCWNPVLFQKPGGELLLFSKVGPDPRTWWGVVRSSGDGGRTWSEPVRLSSEGTAIEGGPVGPIKNKPVRLADGSLLAPSSTEDKGWRVHFERSADGGTTWDVIGPVNDGRAIGAIQPSILDLGGGKLLALGRTRSSRRIFRIESADSGRTWGEMTLTDLPNPNSGTDAVTLADGRHLLIYNHTETERSPLNIAVSNDGKAWRPVLTLETEPGEFSYPAIIQAADGKVHATYTWKRKKIAHAVIDPRLLP